MGVFARKRKTGTVYYVSFMWNGELVQERAGTDRRAAENLERARKREVAAGTYAPGRTSGSVTLSSYAKGWLASRKNRTKRDDEQRFDHHIRPHLGAKRLTDIEPRDVRDWILALRAESDLGGKSIVNVHAVLSGMLKTAAFEGLIPSNPASASLLPEGTLPRRGRKAMPVFRREELERLLTHEAIPADRRMLYALLGLGGMRLGEGCGRRWRDLDERARPLQMLTVESQYEDEPLKGDDGELVRPRQVPVHPALAELLNEWRRKGFAESFGRHPKLGDLIVPDLHTKRARTKNQTIKALYRDLEKAKIERKGTHAFRRFFVTFARSDGARSDVVERITHNAKGEQIDGYTYFGWDVLCEAVACLRIDLRRGEVVQMARVAATGSHDATHDATRETQSNYPISHAKIVEAPGLEHGSKRGKVGKTMETGGIGTGHNGPSFQGDRKVGVQRMTRVMRSLRSALKHFQRTGREEEVEDVRLALELLARLE